MFVRTQQQLLSVHSSSLLSYLLCQLLLLSTCLIETDLQVLLVTLFDCQNRTSQNLSTEGESRNETDVEKTWNLNSDIIVIAHSAKPSRASETNFESANRNGNKGNTFDSFESTSPQKNEAAKTGLPRHIYTCTICDTCGTRPSPVHAHDVDLSNNQGPISYLQLINHQLILCRSRQEQRATLRIRLYIDHS